MIDTPSGWQRHLPCNQKLRYTGWMKLSDWLFENSMTPRQLRVMLGVKNRSTLHRWMTNERIPAPRVLQKIIEITKGEVQLEDFLDPNPPIHAREEKRPDGSLKWILPWSLDAGRNEQEPRPTLPRLSPPLLRAIDALGGRAWYTPSGKFLLDGRLSDPKRLVTAANEILRERGGPTIKYPIVEPIHD